MADRDPYELYLATVLHEAEREVARANAAPAGPQRMERIIKAGLELMKASQRLDHFLIGQACAPIKVER